MTIAEIRQGVLDLDQLTREAFVEEVIVVPLDEIGAHRWRRIASADLDPWVFVAGGGKTLAVDRPSDAGEKDPVAAVAFSPIHTQLVGWWLFHAWRSIDLLTSALDASSRGTTSIAAVTVRALIEELGCLVAEVVQVRRTWESIKAKKVGAVRRAELVRQELSPLLTRMEIASRMSGRPPTVPNATNVVTYVERLDKLSKTSKFSGWYDWLSDAAHPAFAARLVYVSNPLRHPSGATLIRLHSRAPLSLVNSSGDRSRLTYDVDLQAGAALETCGAHLLDFLMAALKVVDDFGLTTKAASLTDRTYWRNVKPAPGSECPCACGPWDLSHHSWEMPAPVLPSLLSK